MSTLSTILQVLLGLAFLFFGGAKLAGAKTPAKEFERYRYRGGC